MKIEIELLDAFVVQQPPGGDSKKARVAQVRFQSEPRKQWREVNLVVTAESVSSVVAGAAQWLEAEGL